MIDKYWGDITRRNINTDVWSNLWWNLIHLRVPCLDHPAKWSQSKSITPTTITQTYSCFRRFSFLICFMSFDPFHSFTYFTFSPLFYLIPQFLKCKFLIWRSPSLNKGRNNSTKPVINVWFIYFPTCFYLNQKCTAPPSL